MLVMAEGGWCFKRFGRRAIKVTFQCYAIGSCTDENTNENRLATLFAEAHSFCMIYIRNRMSSGKNDRDCLVGHVPSGKVATGLEPMQIC
jgi:hypothetical protein